MLNWRLSWPNPALCFILAGLAVGDYSQFTKFTQKYFKEGINDAIVPQAPLMDRLLTATKVFTGFSYPQEYASPWDPLSQSEMRLAALVVRAYNSSSNWQFKCIGIVEVNKTLVLPYYLSGTNPPPGLVPRIVTVLIADPIKRLPISVIVNLSSMQVEKWTEAEPDQKVSVITIEDKASASEIALEDPNVRLRLGTLGYLDTKNVITDTWDGGYVADNPKYAKATKLIQVFLYGVDSNYFAHPIGFVVYVDLGPNVVLGIENLPIHEGFDTNNRTGESVPRQGAPYYPEDVPLGTIRTDLKPLTITQKDGPSFLIEGRKITWQNFQFRVGYNPREGPHIYTVTYNDNGKVRALFYRLSISEVFLQYGDPRPPYHRKSPFEMGNSEFGSSIDELLEKQFCRGDARYFQSDHHNEAAETWVVPRSICIVEEDAGLSWVHYDRTLDKMAVSRAQRLSLSFLSTIGNAEYWVSWRFYTDATVEFAIKMVGILSTNLLAVDVKAPPYGNLMQPQVYAQDYYHYFALRIDADIDGVDNTVSVEDIVSVEPPNNPYGNGIKLNATVFNTAGESPSDINPATARFWRISNPNKLQPLNEKPSSWKLIPRGQLNQNFLTANSPLRERARWTDHSTWVLPYNPDQIFAGGLFLDSGLANWTYGNPNADIENTDVVIWHVARSVHVPDVEDWPVFSSDEGLTGLRLRPSNFLKNNPAVTDPPASETTAGDGEGPGETGWGPLNPNPHLTGWNSSK
ncbi:Copper amine oxidase 1 [Orchesella cincta]|uniref:Amine oxidase n=1 Tax=Orchesella cincta TaxID=48709 RepID=A0A1D2NK44_ORCCI|nr:Copper amine oxidase 1 [Orchesella cincta]